MKKRILFGITLFISCLGIVTKVGASSSLSVSSTSPAVGGKVTVTAKVSNVASWNIKISASGAVTQVSGTTAAADSSDDAKNTTKTISVTYKANSIGSAKFTLTGDATNENGVKEYISTSKSINIVAPRVLSTDNNLSELSIVGAELLPSFDKDITKYTVYLEPGTTSIEVGAKVSNKYASISGTGAINVIEGNNTVDINVTSESGSTKTYTIIAIVNEYEPINVNIGSSDFTVVRKKDMLIKPELYEETTVKINEYDVPAFYNATAGYTLVGLKDVSGEIALYIYNINDNSYTLYQELKSNKLSLILQKIDSTKIPLGYKKGFINIDGVEYECYENKSLNSVLLYGKNIENGHTGFYVYDRDEKTLQKYNPSMINKIELYTYIILGLGTGLLIFIIALIVVIIKKDKKLKSKKQEVEKTLKLDVEAIKKEAKPSKKELKDQKKKAKLEKKEQKKLQEAKEEALEKEQIEKKKLAKLEAKRNKDKSIKDNESKDKDMYQF